MRVVQQCICFSLVFVLFVVVIVPFSSATEIFVDTSTGGGQVGGFYGLYDPNVDDPPTSYPPTLPADNDPTFQNYFMGRSTFGPLATGTTSPERRVFFFFDMAGVAASIPSGEVITGLTIDLTLTAGGSSALANFTGDVEVVDFSSTSFDPAEILDPNSAAISPIAIWGTFGTSVPYGGFELIGPDHPFDPPTVPGKYTIPLPGALPDLEASIGAGDIFIVTARLATFDPDPIGLGAPPAFDPYEYVFGITDVVSPSGSTVDAPELVIMTAPIPEPSCLSLLAIGLACWGCLRRKA